MKSEKVYTIEVLYRETSWGTVYVEVPATSEAEARELFEDDPWMYEWENWTPSDSEIEDWDVHSIDFSEAATKRLKEAEQIAKMTNRMTHEDMDD